MAFAAYAAFEGKVKLSKYGPERWISWEHDPLLYGSGVGATCLLGAGLLFVAWRQSRQP